MKRISIILCSGLLALGACDSDSSGGTDTSTPPTDTVVGDTSVPPGDTTPPVGDPGTVKALQAEAFAAGCDTAGIQTVNPSVSVKGVVVTSPKYDAFTPDDVNGQALDGYYVADVDGGLFSGINLVVDRALDTNFLPGDVLDIEGSLEELFCFTQLKLVSFTQGTSIAAPTPVTVQPADVKTEAYESMLVKIENVTVSEAVGTGVYKVDEGVLIDHEFDFFLSLDVGKSYTITGQVRWAFNEWRLMPRTLGDIIKTSAGTGTAITAIQSGTNSTTCTMDSIQNFDRDIDVNGVVTVGKFFVTSSLDGYFVSDGTQDPYSGIMVTISRTQATNFKVGDEVAINANYIEFYCSTQLSANSIQKTGDGTVPAPIPIASGLSGSELEKWEGTIVEVPNVKVTAHDAHGGAETDAGFLIDDTIVGPSLTLPAVGTTVPKVRGAVTYSFSKYRVSPRSAADLVDDNATQ